MAGFQILSIFCSVHFLFFRSFHNKCYGIRRKKVLQKKNVWLIISIRYVRWWTEAGRGQPVGQRASSAFTHCWWFLSALQPPPSVTSLATHRRSPSKAVLSGVGHRKLALPNVGIMLALRLQSVAPGEESVRRDTGISLSNRHRLLDESQEEEGSERENTACLFRVSYF